MRGLKERAWEWEGAEAWERQEGAGSCKGERPGRLHEPWSGRVEEHGMGELDRGLGGEGL